ncbi:hypothetical protein P7C70_g1636, partial [Phenoliferia sp. Uapishka_3]
MNGESPEDPPSVQTSTSPNAYEAGSNDAAGRVDSRAREATRQGRRYNSQQRRKNLPWWKRPSVIWLLPGHCLFTSLNGAGNQVSYEIMMKLACRDVLPQSFSGAHDVTPASYVDKLSRFAALDVQTPDANDPEWLEKCRESSPVQKRTTRFVTLNLMVGGVLSAVTSKFWARISDRRGRKPLLALAAVSDIINYSGQLFVALHPSLGFKTLLASTAVAYSIGGGTTAQAVTYAYASDCLPPGVSKASTFSLIDGCLSLGLILGPFISSLAIHYTHQILTSFYAMLGCRTAYLAILLLLIPESLDPDRLQTQRESETPSHSSRWRPGSVLRTTVRHLWAPVSILIPYRQLPSTFSALSEDCQPLLHDRGKPSTRVREWNLFWLASTFALVSVNPASHFLYGRFKFSWHVEQTGYWTSFNSLSKLVVLVLIIPFLSSRLRRPSPSPKSLSARLDEPLSSESCDLERIYVADPAKEITADSTFDIKLAFTSIFFGCIGYLIMSIPSDNPALFLVGTAVVQGSGGVVPAVQSLALSLTPQEDAGQVLAALSVLASLSVQILGPLIFGSVYILSIDWLPEMAFMLGAVWWAVAWIPARRVIMGVARGGPDATCALDSPIERFSEGRRNPL